MDAILPPPPPPPPRDDLFAYCIIYAGSLWIVASQDFGEAFMHHFALCWLDDSIQLGAEWHITTVAYRVVNMLMLKMKKCSWKLFSFKKNLLVQTRARRFKDIKGVH